MASRPWLNCDLVFVVAVVRRGVLLCADHARVRRAGVRLQFVPVWRPSIRFSHLADLFDDESLHRVVTGAARYAFWVVALRRKCQQIPACWARPAGRIAVVGRRGQCAGR
jgi:hypothetical protein